MAVVKEYRLESGVVIKINDAAFADKSSNELEAVRTNISKVAGQLLYRQYQEKLQPQ